MSGTGSTTIVVVSEAVADFKTACILTDRALIEASERAGGWITPDLIEHIRQYRGITDATPFVRWIEVKELVAHAEAGGFRIRIRSRFNDGIGQPDADSARKILTLLQARGDVPDAVILSRDLDQSPERLAGLQQAKSLPGWTFVVLLAAADPKLEAWLLAAFQPATREEENRIDSLKQELGFDPRTEAFLLSASLETAKRSAKRVLAALSGDDASRGHAGLTDTPLDILRERGAVTGLRAFLDDVENDLLPLLDPSAGRGDPSVH